jgi:hypothetical protein
MLLLNKIKTDLNLTRNEFIYGLVTTTRRLERLAAQVEVTYKFCAAPKEAARVAVGSGHKPPICAKYEENVGGQRQAP